MPRSLQPLEQALLQQQLRSTLRENRRRELRGVADENALPRPELQRYEARRLRGLRRLIDYDDREAVFACVHEIHDGSHNGRVTMGESL